MFYTNDASRAALRDDAVAAVRVALISNGAIAAVCANRRTTTLIATLNADC